MQILLRSAGLGLAVLAAAISASQTKLLVGAQGLTEASVKAAVGNRGQVQGPTTDGFYIVDLNKGEKLEAFKAHMKASKIEFVFDSSADKVDKDNIHSLRQHIEFVKARYKVQGTGDDYKKTPGFYAALEYYLSTRVGPDGTVDQDLVKRAVEHRDQLPPATWGGGGNAPSGTFSYMGPRGLDIPQQRWFGIAPLAGRVNQIAWSPTNPNVVYLATAGGGVWKTTNQGTNWSYLSSGWQFLHTTGIAVDPANENIVLAGTGDAYGFFGAQTMGIMRSTNGGATWTQVGAAQFGNNIVTRIMFHPTFSNIVIALTAGANGDIWRSTDGGVTWAATDAPAGKWDDIDFGPVSNGIREFWAVSGNGTAGGVIARSTNQGGNWTVMNDATTTVQSRLDVACSKTTFGKVYVIHPNSNTMFRTTNSGTSWTNLNLSSSATFPNASGDNSSYNWSQDQYDLHVTTSAYGNSEYVWVGLITLAVSLDSGATWLDFGRSYQSTSRLHNDQHTFTPHPTLGYIGMAGNDGGVFRTTYLPGVLNSIASLNNTLFNTQFYHMSTHPTNYAQYIMGGTQDNASPASRGDFNAWKNLQGGDGSWSDFQPSNPAIHFSSSQNARVWRYTTNTDLVPDDISATWSSSNFIAPAMYTGNSTLIVGANSTAMRWTGVAGVWNSSTSFGGNARVFAKGISNTARIYAGTGNRVYRSDDNAVTWHRIDAAPLPASAIGGIATSWTNSVDVIVGINRPTGGLFRCADTTAASPTWTNVSGTGALALPQSPVNAVARDPYQTSIWYVGTDIGLFMTTDSGATWKNMNALGLPNVHVNALKVTNDKAYLYVATFGRGIWRIPLVNNTFNSFTTSATEVFGDRSLTGTLQIASPAPAGGVRAVLSTVSPYVTMPSEVWFSSGASSRSFTITTSQVFSSNKIAYLYANCMGTTRSVTLTIKPYPTVASFVLANNYLYGGASTTGTATISAPAPYIGSFTFTESSAFVSVVSPITIGVGETSKLTTITTTKPVTVQSVPITAAYKGTTRVATIHVYPHPVVSSLTFTPNPLLGGNYATCTITLNVPAPITTQIAMQDDSPYIATSAKTIQAGQQSLSFSVYGSNPPQDVDVRVQARVWEDTGQATETTLRLLRSELISIVAPKTIKGGSSAGATITINRAQPTNKAIMLSSDNAVLQVPLSVTLVAGNTTVGATLRTLPVLSSTNVVVSASYLSTTVRTTVTVTP